MPWTRKLANKIKLKDGRTIGTLNQARELLLSIPPTQRETSLWRYIAKALDDAASERASVEPGCSDGQIRRPIANKRPSPAINNRAHHRCRRPQHDEQSQRNDHIRQQEPEPARQFYRRQPKRLSARKRQRENIWSSRAPEIRLDNAMRAATFLS
jgi:hypothetical protein